jgi:DNA-binding transcriptional regulator PaaX
VRRVIFDTDVARIAGQSPAWRWTQLHDAIIANTGFCPSTVRRAINRGVQSGVLQKQGGVYRLAGADHHGSLIADGEYRALDRRELLGVLAEREAWPYTPMLRELRHRLGVAESTLRTSLIYARQYGYLEHTDHGWALTDRCRQQLALYGRLEGAEGFRFASFVSGHPKRGLRRHS